jgi:hypothetical protein
MFYTSIFAHFCFNIAIAFTSFIHVCIILDEWTNLLERLGSKITNEDIRYWASFRGQTLSRTGNMEYRSYFF